MEQSEGANGLKRKRRDTPWLSRRAEDPSGRRANLSEAVNGARRSRERRSRKLPIEELFEANSSKEATAARRRTVKRIMDTLEADFPLTSRTLMEVASSLKMAGYKAGVNYLVDCKLWHVEEGHPWTELLDRTFKKCKRGLDRGKGPRRRAPEVVLTARVKAREDKKKPKAQIHFARELLEFGRCWMLREAEIAILSTPDVRVDYVLKRVRLRIPVSKKDQEAEGVQRVLQCLCGGGGCTPEVGRRSIKALCGQRKEGSHESNVGGELGENLQAEGHRTFSEKNRSAGLHQIRVGRLSGGLLGQVEEQRNPAVRRGGIGVDARKSWTGVYGAGRHRQGGCSQRGGPWKIRRMEGGTRGGDQSYEGVDGRLPRRMGGKEKILDRVGSSKHQTTSGAQEPGDLCGFAPHGLAHSLRLGILRQ